jgi:histone H3/H4
MADLLVVKAKIKEVKGLEDMNVAGDFADELSKKVETLIKDAATRAAANGRKTVQAKDL